VNEIVLPSGFRWERLRREYRRREFSCGEVPVDDWLKTKALQHQSKHLSVTKVLLNAADQIAGYFTLATGQVSFADLPTEIAERLPKRELPVAVLAWLGVSRNVQGQGLGRLLLAQALRDRYFAGQTFPFVAVILDCLNESAKAFYRRWDFQELPGHPFRLFLGAAQLETMMRGDSAASSGTL
jgi:ribosomal protein S18 acetylase RimI-like enzyme